MSDYGSPTITDIVQVSEEIASDEDTAEDVTAGDIATTVFAEYSDA